MENGVEMQFLRKSHQLGPSSEREIMALNNEPPMLNEANSNGSIFEALVYEMHSAALLTAAIASAVNALCERTARCSVASLKPYMPHESAIVTALRNLMIESDIGEDTVSVISDYFHDLGPARTALDRFFADADHIGDERASTLHLFSLTNSWHQACTHALTVIQKLHHDVVRKLSAQYAGNSNVLMKLLAEAADGGSPCLDAEGQIRLPDLPQRRHSARRTLCQPCIFTHDRNTSQAFVRDVSSTGLGLERVPQLVPDSVVRVELPSGRSFVGVVAWCEGSAAGIRFAKPLLPNDPLLWG